MARQVLDNGIVLPSEYSDDWYDDMTSNLTKLDEVIGSDSEKLSSADVGAAALSNNYNDLDNLPTIPTVNDATLTIQKNGVDVQTFTANASSNVTANITVPTKTSDLTNDSNFVDTSNSAVSSGITSAKVTDYDTHIADTDIHVTTADKNRWNNNTYVLRYSSTTLVASSTNSNSLLDNTDNLKVGDKVIDSDGVLFSITAIDTANSTFTIGSALIDLALDANVVHTSGDETVYGVKTFSSGTQIYNANSSNNTPSMFLRTSKVSRGSTTDGSDNISLMFNDSGNSLLSSVRCTKLSNGTTQLRNIVVTMDTSNNIITFETQLNISKNGDKYFIPSEDNNVSLGKSGNRWKDVQTYLINGLTPSSLGMPMTRDNAIDISGYFTNFNNGETNQYSPTVNGWIYLETTGCNALHCFCTTTGNLVHYGNTVARANDGMAYVTFPVLANTLFRCTWYTNSTITLSRACFIPCQGNV